jgi:hypothetical protein
MRLVKRIVFGIEDVRQFPPVAFVGIKDYDFLFHIVFWFPPDPLMVMFDAV